MEVGQIRQRRLSDNIVEQLETMILEGTLQPGQRLPAERALAENTDTSADTIASLEADQATAKQALDAAAKAFAAHMASKGTD